MKRSDRETEIKYKRLRTLSKKSVETTQICPGLMINLIVYDLKFNKITEYFTHESFNIENFKLMLDRSEVDPVKCPCPQIRSVDSTQRL